MNTAAWPRDPFFSRMTVALIKLFLFVFFRPAFATARSPAWNIAAPDPLKAGAAP